MSTELIKDDLEETFEVRPDVMTVEEIMSMSPNLKGKKRLIEFVMRLLQLDRVNWVHGSCSNTPGPQFVKRLVEDLFSVKVKVDNEEVLDRFKEGPFITVSNHPMGAMDGILLLYIVTAKRPRYKVMVNMMLNKLSGMRPNFIAVDALASNDPAKRQVSVTGLRRVLRQLKAGEPVGFFPAGAVGKWNKKWEVEDREWQDSVLQLIKKAKVPVIPIYFHDINSWWFNVLGKISWQLRTLRLPSEVFNKIGTTMHVTIGEPISPEQQAEHGATTKDLGDFLRQRTYALKNEGAR